MEERRRRSNNLNETSEPAAQFLCVCCELVSLALFLRFFCFLGLLSIACRKRGSACEISEMSQKPEMRQVCILNLVTSKKMKERETEKSSLRIPENLPRRVLGLCGSDTGHTGDTGARTGGGGPFSSRTRTPDTAVNFPGRK